jgi:serine phosphatase RsbU (regulator of sigma subunit)
LILLFSDGIQDQSNSAKALYGESRLRQFLCESHRMPAKDLVAALLNDIDSFRAGERVQDDQTVIAIRVKGDQADLAL